jgi:putative redox protein
MNIDKSKELVTSITLLNQKLHFEGSVEGNPSLSIDYTAPLGDGQGYTSLELFLLSLSSCAGSAMLVLLRKMGKEIQSFSIQSHGQRKSEHPTGFSKIQLMMEIASPGLTAAEVDKALGLMHGLCPVLSMLNESVEVQFSYEIK